MENSLSLLEGSEPMIEKILRLEDYLLNDPENQLDIEPVHYLADGLYAREITIPAGVVATGKIHKFEHINIVSKGTISVWTEEGLRRIDAPATLISQPGMKRVGYAHADTVWTTIHAIPGGVDLSPADLEAALVCSTFKEYAEFLEWVNQLELEGV